MIEPGDFDCHAAKPAILEGLTMEMCREMRPAEKMEICFIAREQVKDLHALWYREQFPKASDVEVWGDWLRVTECSPILAKAMRDAAERDSDIRFLVEVREV